RYALVLILFALGLAAKPTLVMFPATLLLLDYWPLKRLPTPDRVLLRGIVLEKLPMFAMAGLAGIVTVHFQAMNHAAQAMAVLPLGLRVQNAASSIARYLRMFVWPTNLAFFYPHPAFTGISVTTAATIGVLLLVAITIVVIALRRSMPYLLWGWLWFLLVLLPVLG